MGSRESYAVEVSGSLYPERVKDRGSYDLSQQEVWLMAKLIYNSP